MYVTCRFKFKTLFPAASFGDGYRWQPLPW